MNLRAICPNCGGKIHTQPRGLGHITWARSWFLVKTGSECQHCGVALSGRVRANNTAELASDAEDRERKREQRKEEREERIQPGPFEKGEKVRWEARANRFQQKIRSVGGHIYLTDRRLIFTPSKLEGKLDGFGWSAQLSDLDSAFVKGPVKSVQVVANSGETQRFVIWPRVESAATINAAIRAAKEEDSEELEER